MGSWASAEEAWERIGAALDAIDAAHAVLRDISSDVVGNEFRVDVAERLETQDRTNRGLMYRFFAEIADPPDGSECLPAVREMLWARLRITPRDRSPRQARGPDPAAALADRPSGAPGAGGTGRRGGSRRRR
jgi:hypothetical protein